MTLTLVFCLLFSLSPSQAVYDTAGAAADIAKRQLKNTAAIASGHAAEIYGLEVLAEGIQDDKLNVTRFMALAREPATRESLSRQGIDTCGTGSMKTSIVFTLNEGPGMLFKALSVFALRDIDLTKIESRPLRTSPLGDVAGMQGKRFNYLFYVDFLAGMDQRDAQNALRHLTEIAPFLRVLGSYPANAVPHGLDDAVGVADAADIAAAKSVGTAETLRA